MAAISPKRSPSRPEIQGYTATEKYPKIRSIEVTAADFSGYHPQPIDIILGNGKTDKQFQKTCADNKKQGITQKYCGNENNQGQQPPQRIMKISPKRSESLETRLRERMIPIQNAERAKLDMKALESLEESANRGIQVFSTPCTPI